MPNISKLTLNDREKIAVYASAIEKVPIPDVSSEEKKFAIMMRVQTIIKSLEKLAGDM